MDSIAGEKAKSRETAPGLPESLSVSFSKSINSVGGLQLLHDLVNGEAGRLLARRKVLESRQELSNICLRRYQQKSMVHPPVPVGVRGDGRPLIWISAQVKKPWYPRIYQGLAPDQHGALCSLLGEDHLPVIVAERLHVAIVGEIEELLAGTLFLLAGQVRQEVVSVKMNLVFHIARLMAFL